MASGITKIADVVVPDVFGGYVQQITEEKSRLIAAGIVARDSDLDNKLAGGGLIFETPSWKDLDNDEENVSNDDDSDDSSPNKIGTALEKAVRLNRNNSWSAMDLTSVLAGSDPMAAIGSRVGAYWERRSQACFVAVMQGIFADNAAAASGTDTHTQNDLTVDISGGSYVAGVTDFSAEAVIDAATTMGDSMNKLSGIMVHSVVYSRMLKNNLIDFLPDSEGRLTIPTFMGYGVVVDDGVPNPAGSGAAATASGIYHTWLFGPGAVRWGVGTPDVPTEIDRKAEKGNGAGQETLFNRVQWCMHPVGHAYIGTPTTKGGPSNATSANNLAHAGSWSRVWSQRKMINIARLITRES